MTHNSRLAASVHILAYLAFRTGASVPSAEIARSVDTNPVVIRRLLSALTRAGLVRAQKGSAGGFALDRPADRITLLDIYRAVEPQPDNGLSHFAPNRQCPVGAKIEAVLGALFHQAQVQMEAELGRTTLAGVEVALHEHCPSHLAGPRP